MRIEYDCSNLFSLCTQTENCPKGLFLPKMKESNSTCGCLRKAKRQEERGGERKEGLQLFQSTSRITMDGRRIEGEEGGWLLHMGNACLNKRNRGAGEGREGDIDHCLSKKGGEDEGRSTSCLSTSLPRRFFTSFLTASSSSSSSSRSSRVLSLLYLLLFFLLSSSSILVQATSYANPQYWGR